MKINKNLIILSLLLIFCISLGAVSAADNTDISVNDINNDDITTVESSVNDDEISTVSEGIHNSSEIYYKIKSATGTYNITKDYQIDQTWEISNPNVIIEGNNHTIYGNGKQAFLIKGNSVTIKNLNFVGCSDFQGSAICFYKYGVVDNCIFSDCSATYYGGAIYFSGSGSVKDCIFSDCSASDRGGAIYFYSSSGSVKDCIFSDCSATSKGGAICFENLGSDSVVGYCSFVGCSASNGGAIYFVSGGSSGSVNYCIFDNVDASVGKVIYGDFNNYNFNFFSFKNNIGFPKGLIGNDLGSILPNSWVVLDVTRSGDDYIVKFVTDEGNNLNMSMPDYTACLSINGVAKEILIKNNTFTGTFVPGNYVVTSLNSSNVLANVTFKKDIGKLGTSLSASTLTISAYASKNLVVTLKDSNGKVLSGKKVTINFNGKTYNRTTDSKGQAKLSITSKVVKNYTATIKFTGDNNYTASSKSVKVVIKPAYVTVADIIKAAKTLKSYSSKNKKLPSTIKVGSYKLTHAQLTYLMTVAIKHIKAGKKTSTKVKVINVKYTVYNAKISKKIMKKGYLSVVNTLYSKGVKGTLPKYFTYGGKKIGYNPYAYSLAKILAFYSSKHRLPNYCVFVNY